MRRSMYRKRQDMDHPVNEAWPEMARMAVDS